MSAREEKTPGPPPRNNPFAKLRELAKDLPPGPISVAAVTVGAGGEQQVVLPGEEFMLVRSGTLVLRQAGAEIALAAGEQALLLRGLPLSWSSAEGAQLVVLRCTAGAAPAIAQPVKIDTGATLAPSNPPLAELLVGPTPQCRSHASYRSAPGEFVCGTWDSTPYHRLPMTFQHFELMHLLQGSVTFVDSDGTAGTFVTGDAVLFVRGGTVSVDVALDGELPRGARPDLSVDGTIEIDRIPNALHVGRPADGSTEATTDLFRLDPDGRTATRVRVRVGRGSADDVEVLDGLKEGDRVILSEMSQYGSAARVTLK